MDSRWNWQYQFQVKNNDAWQNAA